MITISYTDLQLDRGGERRKDDAWLESQWLQASTRIIPVWQDKSPLVNVDRQAQALLISASLMPDQISDWREAIYLGEDSAGPIFALAFEQANAPALPLNEAESNWTDLRQIGWMLDHQEAALLAFARGMVYWNRHHRFCGSCGHPTRSEQAGHVRRCSNKSCGRVHFPRTSCWWKTSACRENLNVCWGVMHGFHFE